MTLPSFQTGFLQESDGASKPYVMIGSGPTPMVIVPGAADGLRTCVDVALYLAWFYRQRAKDFRLLILSRRQPIPERFGVQRHAEDMIRTVEQLDWGPAVWECLSAAGPIGQCVAVSRPDLVPGLILAATYDHVAARTKRVFQQWLDIAERAGGDELWELIEHKYRPPADVLSKVEPERLPGKSALSEPRRLAHILLDLVELDHRELVSRISCPTLVIGGDEDRVVPFDAQRQMAKRIPNHQLEICPGYGHFNDMDNPGYPELVERFARAIIMRLAER